MSKLAEQVRKSTRIEPRRLGFGGAAAAASPSLVVVALSDSPGPSDGADIVLVRGDKPPRGKSETVFGLLQPELTAAGAAAAVEAGADFVVFDPDRTEAAALLTENLGFVATISTDMTDVELRVLEALPLDAIYLPELPRPLTVRAQLAVQRVSVLAHAPLLVPAAGLGAGDIEALRECGVVLLLAEGANAVKELRKTVDGLPPRKIRRDGRGPDVVLPRAPAAVEEEEEEEEEYGE